MTEKVEQIGPAEEPEAKPYTLKRSRSGKLIGEVIGGIGTFGDLPTEPGPGMYVIEGRKATWHPDGLPDEDAEPEEPIE